MEYRTLGNSGTVVSAQCLGTMTFGSEADEATSGAILEAFVEAGGNFVDTADVYSGGASEEIIGRWLAAHPSRGGPDRAGHQGPVRQGRRSERSGLCPAATCRMPSTPP